MADYFPLIVDAANSTIDELPAGDNLNLASSNIVNAANITANYFIGDGSQLTNVPIGTTLANGNSNVAIPTINGNVTISSAGNANIVVITGTGVNVAGTVNATGTVTGSLLTGTLTTAAQPNITSVGTLSTLAVTANVTAGNVYANLGIIGASLLTGTLTTASQPNITTVGTLTSLNVSGNANLGNLGTTQILATANVTSPQLISNIATGSAPLIVSSTTKVANLNADLLDGYSTSTAATNDTVAVRDVNGNLAANNISGTLSTAAQPNITSVGTLTGLVTSGDITPSTTNTYSLGNTTNRWNNLWLAGNTIYLGNADIKANATAVIITNPNGGQFVISGNGTASSNTIYNGNSNVSIPSSDGNVNISVNSAANVLVVTADGANVTGTLRATGNANVGNLGAAQILATTSITAPQLVSNVATGTAPLSVISTTKVANLNADLLDGYSTDTTGSANTVAVRDANGNVAANYFIGNGSQLTGIIQSRIESGTSNVQVDTGGAIRVSSAGNANVVVINGTGLTVTGFANVSGNIAGNNISANGNITANTGITITNGPLTLTNGNLDVTGNINVTGNLNYSNVTDLVVGDPLIYIGANNTGDTVDLGMVASYNNGTYYHTGIARNSTTDYWTFFDGVVAEPTTVIDWANATYPTVKLGNLIATGNANIAGTANIVGNANVGNVGAAAGVFTANITAGNVYANSGTIGAQTLKGDGGNISNIQGANVSGAVATATNATTAGTVTTATQPNITSVGTLSSLAVTANVIAGNVYANSGTIGALTLKGEGGNISNIQGANVSGTVSSATTAGTVTTAAQPNITSVGTLTSLSVSGNGTFGNILGPHANGNSNVNIPAANGNVTISAAGNANIAVITGTGVNVSGTLNATGNANVGNIGATTGVFTNVSGNGSGLSSITGANVTGQVGNATVAGTVYTAAQPNITSVGTLTSLSVSGNGTFGNILGPHANGNSNVNIPAANGNVNISAAGNANVFVVTGTGANITGTANVSGNLAAGNISANVATLTTANVTGNLTAGNITTGSGSGGNISGANVITANTFIGALANGNSNVNIPSANGNVNISAVGNANVFVVTGTGVNVSGTLNTGSGVITGNGSGLTAIAGANVTGQVANALVAGTVYTAAQPNITSVGTLSSLSVTANVTAGNLVGIFANGNSSISIPAANGNINFSAGGATNELVITTTGVNVAGTLNATGNANVGNLGTAQVLASANVTAPQLISNVATGTAPLSVISTTKVANLNADLLDGYSTDTAGSANTVAVRDANANIYGNNFVGTTYTSNVATGTAPFAVTSTTRVSNLNVANAGYADSAGTAGSATSATTAGTVTTNAQPNITSVGTLTSLGVNGTITGVNITANTGVFTGNANGLTAIPGANVTGAVPSATSATNASALLQNTSTATTVYPTFSTSSANGNSSAVINTGISANLGNASITATTFVGALSGAATTAGTVTTAAQPNITSLGTLTSLGVNGTITGVNITANTGVFTGNGSGLTNLAGANVTGTVANATYATSAGSATTAGTVTTAAQPNITSVGTLTSLNVSGNANVGNLGTAQVLASANVTAPQLISNVATGTAPLVVTSTTQVGNLNAQYLNGFTWAIPAGIGTTTANSGAFTTISASGQITSTLASGTAPMVVTSTTKVANLNVEQVDGYHADTANTVSTIVVRDAASNIAVGNVTAGGNITSGTGITVTTGGMNVTGNINVTGNFNVTGNLNYSNVTDLVVGDPLIYIGANNTGDIVDLGIVASYNNGTYKHTGIARNYTNDIWTFFDGVVAEPTTVIDWANATYPTVKAGNIQLTGNVTAPTLISNVATGTAPLTVTSTTRVGNLNVAYANVADFINVTAPGTGTGYVVFANTTSGNVAEWVSSGITSNLANNSITATTFVGALSGAATTAGTVTTAAQPNITSVGTLTSLTSSGNISGANVVITAYQYESVSGAVAAAGTVQSNATALTTQINVVSTVASGAGVRLPDTGAGVRITIMNTTANALLVYPPTGDAINSLAANAAYTQPAGARLDYVSTSATQWYTLNATYG